jgi:hypothetical protein
MDLTFAGTAVCMLAVAAGMIYYEHARSRAGRSLRQHEAIAIPYWITYLSMLLLGSAFMLAAFVR